jgi:hypothetical protein
MDMLPGIENKEQPNDAAPAYTFYVERASTTHSWRHGLERTAGFYRVTIQGTSRDEQEISEQEFLDARARGERTKFYS